MAAASQAASGEFDSRRLHQKDKRTQSGAFLFLEYNELRRESRVGAVLREQNALPTRAVLQKT